MKRLTLPIILTVLVGLVPQLKASVFYWDPEGTTTPSAANKTATWDTTTAQWSSASSLSSSLVSWSPSSIFGTNAACFAAAAASPGQTYTVTVNQNITMGGIFNGSLGPGGDFVTLNGSGSLIVASGVTAAFSTGGSDGGTTTLNIPISGAGIVNPQGTKQIFFNVANSYTGGTILNASCLVNFNNASSFSAGTITLAGSGNALIANTSGLTIANNFTSTLAQGLNPFNLSASLAPATTTYSGNWSLPVNCGIGVGGGANNTAILTGVVSGAGGMSRQTQSPAGTLILQGTNTFTGPITNLAGVYQIGGSGKLGNGSYAGVIANSGTFAYASSANQTLSGVISGAGNLVQSGSGTLTLSGVDTFTGGISNAAGSTLTIGSAGTLVANLITNNGTINYASSGNSTWSSVISGTGNINKSSTGTLTISAAANTFTGKVSVTGGGVTINNGDTLGAAPGSFVADQLTLDGGTLTLGTAVNVSLAANRGITLGSGNGTITLGSKTLTVPGTITGPGGLSKSGSSALILTAAHNDFAGNFNINGGEVDFNSSANDAAGHGDIVVTPGTITTLRSTLASTAATITNNITINPGSAVCDTFAASGASLTYSGIISGAGGFDRGNGGGAGNIILSGNNTFTGSLTNQQGPIVLGHKNALGAGTFVISPNSISASLSPTISANTDLSGANAITTAVIVQAGTAGSTFILTGANNMEFGNGVTLNTSPLITNTCTATVKFSGAISGANGLNFYGTGTTVLSGTSSYTGATALNKGTLQIDGDITASSGVTVGGGTLKGNGTISALTVNSGAVNPGASPGTLSVTNGVAFNAGSTNVVEINDFAGTAGSNPGWDLILANTIAFNGVTTFKVNSLNGTSSGAAANFVNSQDYDLVIGHATNGISAGDTTLITVDSSDFSANNTVAAGGFFSVVAITNIDLSVNLVLQYRRAAAITVQPSPVTSCIGATANFTVTATGSSPVTYQWQKGGVNLSNGTQPSTSVVTGSTSANLTIAGTQVADADNYTVVVTAAVGAAATSSAASLTVPTAPVIATPASASTSTVNAGDTVNLFVTLSAGTSVSYQWKKGGVNISNGAYDNGATVSGAATANLTLAGVRAFDSADYTCNVTSAGACGSALSPATTVVVVDPFITQQPVSSTFECGLSNALTVTAIGTTNAAGVLTYQWYTPDPSGTAITDATNSVLSFPTVSFLNAGSYSVVISNALGNFVTSSVVVVTIEDTNAPVISVIGGAATVECHAGYSDSGATATDSCDGSVSVSTSGVPDGNTVGIFTVTYSATDSHANTGTATRVVTVQDTTVPTLTLLGSSVVTISCGTPYGDAGATASDSCAGDITGQISVNYGGLVPATPIGGDYTITYNVQDPSANAATPVTRVVHVVDTTPPVITLNGASSVTNECHSTYTDAGATANDNCAGAVTPTTTGIVDANTVGVYTLTYSATDGVNTSTATRVVHVTDTTAPVVTLNGNAAITNECHTAYSDPGASASDDCDAGASVSSSGTVDLNTVGVYTRTYTASDASGNSSTTTRQITVSDTTAPVITVTGGNSATAECHTSYTDAGATAADTCDASPSVGTTGTVDVNTAGSYTLTYTATDASNNSSTATRVVTVSDATAPVVTLNGASSVTVECHGSFSDPGASATDTCDASPGVSTSGAFDANTPGVYTLTYTASDATGNTSSATRTVTVSDTAAPAITLNGTPSMTVECHGSFSDPGATANDACEGPASVNTTGSVDANTVGNYTLTYAACDSGSHCAASTRIVHVVDTMAPVVTLNGTTPMPVECHGSFSDPGATATDDCDASPGIVTSGSVNANLVGSYTLTYTATDANNNSGTATRVVNVTDTVAPVITVTGGDQTVECHGSFTDSGATANDACEGDLSANITVSGTVNTNAVGVYTLTYSVGDSSSNNSSATRVVTVNDTAAPVITVPGSNPDSACQFVTYNDPGATANDACAGSVSVSSSGSVDSSTAGAYTLTYSATDGNGNTATATRVVNVTPCNATITQQPLSTNVNANASFTLSVTAVSGNPITYQWSKNGTNIVNATDATFTVAHAFRTNAGTYTVDVASGPTTITSSNAVVTVNDPVFTTNPASVTVSVGIDKKVTFLAVADGTPSLRYQWYFKTATRTNKLTTSTSLSVNVTLGAAGSYYCVVTNIGHSITATSEVAALQIYQAPKFTKQPAPNNSKFVGQTLVLSVAVGPAQANQVQYGGPVVYQWVRGNPPPGISTVIAEDARHIGTQTPTLTILNIDSTDQALLNDAIAYRCIATNAAPTNVFSHAALLTVKDYTNPPVVVIVKSNNNAIVTTTNQIYMSGTATDKGNITNVSLRQITVDATNDLTSDITYKQNGMHQDLPGNVLWTNFVTLTPGTNAFTASATDTEGNVGASKPVRNIFYLVPQALTLTTNGHGTIQITSLGTLGKPGTTNVNQGIGYTLKAVGTPPHTFHNWTDGDGNPYSGNGTSDTNQTLHFIMPGTNLTLHANFN